MSIRANWAGVLIATALAGSAQATVVVEQGRISGVREGAVTVYKGVPYAAPPVGALRWREPVAPPARRGVRAADAFAPACMQAGVSMPGEPTSPVSEDCLYLNIWRPSGAGAPRPVMVFFPGGGFTNGSASIPLYRGDRLARRGVVVVTVGYRVGPLGFLALPELTRESPHASSGNYGLLDLIAALRWVHRNIAALGGDPRRVTIFGQSAGATSVSILMASPRAAGLFQRAIGESGGLFEPAQLAPQYQLKAAEQDGAAYAAKLGASTLADLRRLPASVFTTPAGFGVSHPVIEPYLMPLSPADAFAEGRQNDVPLLVGSNQDEARSLTSVRDVTAATYEEGIRRRWGPLPKALYNSYPHATDVQAKQARLDFERDLRFGWDAWTWARLQAATGHSPVYAYRFTRKPPFPAGSIYAGWGASHFAELWYVFDHLNELPGGSLPIDRRLANTMAGAWVRFAAKGDPNGRGLPPWAAFKDGADGPIIRFGAVIQTGGVPNLDVLKVFDTVYDVARGRRLIPERGPDANRTGS